MKWIIVGLGNPGSEYEKTRHNAGRIVLEQLRKKFDFSEWEHKKTYDALATKGEIAGAEVLLLEPETFMNASGKSLLTLIISKDQAAQLIVIHDDADLPTGSWRSARDRGAGGQKGVESIIETLKTKDFYRFRIGVAPDAPAGAVRKKAGEFVLEKFADTCIDNETRQLMEEVRKIVIARKHKAFQPETKAHQQFLIAHFEKAKELQAKYPFLDLKEELVYFSQT